MSYRKWAPSILVELHKTQLNKPADTNTPENRVEKKVPLAEKKYNKKYSDDQLKSMLVMEYKKERCLKGEESNKLLLNLLTHDNMRAAWATLAKRINSDEHYLEFWTACQHGIIGWRGIEKITPAERLKKLDKIFKTSIELMDLLNSTPEFYFCNPIDLLDEESRKKFLNFCGINKTHFRQKQNTSTNESGEITLYNVYAEDILPDMFSILFEVAIKALDYQHEQPFVKQPNSKNAPIHYFVRFLSSYLIKTYKTPLHEVVASTTSAIFNEDIDGDYVSKITT